MAEIVPRGYVFVVSFNFGDNESCIASSFIHEPANVWAFTYGPYRELEQSSILLNPERKYDGFGLEADRKYGKLKSRNISENWWFFRSFSKPESSPDGIVVRDDKGRPFSFESLMVIVLQCMGDKVNSVLDENKVRITMADALLVITTPSHWHSHEKGCVYRAMSKVSGSYSGSSQSLVIL
ncbi:hypothetical protein MAR_026945 [Mya arenaria]|uniref:Uncharacterized protein n=1 Tax=Mya arenaria TaxID=6604 RepID=A0ABY7ESD8_MYAAR|nr:hypothetical protein MAR_026945 [Mya arenaria]